MLVTMVIPAFSREQGEGVYFQAVAELVTFKMPYRGLYFITSQILTTVSRKF